MTDRNIDLLALMEKVRSDALPKDWNNQRGKGERKRAFSRSAFDDAMYDTRPEIGTATFLKKVYNYSRHNQTVKIERGIKEAEVISFLHYIFKDIATPYGWPAIIDLFKTFQGGKFYDIIEVFEDDSSAGSQKSESDLYAESAHISIVKMAIKAKRQYQDLATERSLAEKENQALKGKLKQKEEVLNRVRERIALLESMIANRQGEHKEILREIKEMKQKYF